MSFCIPKKFAEKLKQSAMAGEVDIKKLYTLTSEQRKAFFTKHTNKDLGQFLNTEFEKAMISKQQKALVSWAESVFKPKEKKGQVYKSVLDKIKELDNLGVLSPAKDEAFLSDLVAAKLGATITEEETRVISKKAKVIQESFDKVDNNWGNPEFEKHQVDYFSAKKDMDDYLSGLVPQNRMKVLTSTIGRGTMLFSVKSPFLNIESNSVMAITEALTRRFAEKELKGTNTDLALQYVKMVNKIYQKTGYDISRMIGEESISGGDKTLGEMRTHSQGKGAVRKVGRFYEDVVFKQLMGAPDVAFASVHFADTANLMSSKMAKLKGLKGEAAKARAREIMTDAMSMNPKTLEGETVRMQSIADATQSTYTNDTIYSKFALALREAVNKASGDMRLGDLFDPFVKTPANVIGAGIDYAGGGFLHALWKIGKAVKAEGKEGLKDPAMLKAAARDAVRAGIGMTAAGLIGAMIEPDNFMGAYDPNRYAIDTLKNANYNAVKIGGKWISLDYFGALGVPLAAVLYAKKYGNGGIDKTTKYVQGVGTQFSRFPGLSLVADLYDSVKSQNPENKKLTYKEIGVDTANGAIDFMRARLIPSLINDTAKIMDNKERDTSGGAIKKLQASIPVWRESLPVKKNLLGEEVPTESGIAILLFGARVKTANEKPVVKEIGRLFDAGAKPNIVDFVKTSRKDVAQLQEKVGKDEFVNATNFYQQTMRNSFDKILSDKKYQAMSDEDKKKQFDHAVDLAIADTLTKYKVVKKSESRKEITYIIK